MMYQVSELGGACTYVRTYRDVTSRMDTLTAQMQEIQVALLALTKA